MTGEHRIPLPGAKPPGVNRVTWWRARKRGYLTVDYHRAEFRAAHAEDLQLVALLRRSLRYAPRRLGRQALARKCGVPRERVRAWLEERRMPPAEVFPMLREHLLLVLAAAGVREGHPSGCGQYTLRAAAGIWQEEQETE